MQLWPLSLPGPEFLWVFVYHDTHALLDGAPAPAGFAPGALAVAAHVVGHKRATLALTRRPRRLQRSLVFSLFRLVRRLFLRDRAAWW